VYYIQIRRLWYLTPYLYRINNLVYVHAYTNLELLFQINLELLFQIKLELLFQIKLELLFQINLDICFDFFLTIAKADL
jgi:hypothetical protein